MTVLLAQCQQLHAAAAGRRWWSRQLLVCAVLIQAAAAATEPKWQRAGGTLQVGSEKVPWELDVPAGELAAASDRPAGCGEAAGRPISPAARDAAARERSRRARLPARTTCSLQPLGSRRAPRPQRRPSSHPSDPRRKAARCCSNIIGNGSVADDGPHDPPRAAAPNQVLTALRRPSS
jgi:hypothetical protein